MLGWHISLYRIADGVQPQSGAAFQLGARLAVWQAGASGLDWLDALVRDGKALLLGGNGYPVNYAGQARHLLPRITEGPPNANPRWMSGVGDTITRDWVGRTEIDQAAAADCDPDEWLCVEAWDES